MSGATGARFWLGQVWRDEALRSLPVWIVVTALNTSAALGFLALRAHSRPAGASAAAPAALLAVLWLALAVFLAAGRGRARCSRFDLTLPLTSRQLWLSHLGAAVLAGLATLGASIGVVVTHEKLLGVAFGWPSLLAPLGGGLLLAAVVMQSYRWELREPPRGPFNRLSIVLLALVLGLLLVLLRWPLAAAVVPTGLAVVLGYLTWARLAPGFVLVSFEPAEPAASAVVERTPQKVTAGTPAVGSYRAMFTILHHAPPWGVATPWVLYSFVAAIGFVMAGGLGLFLDDQVLRVIYLPLASYSLFSVVYAPLYQIHRLEPFPVPRARVFALMMLPALVVFVLGFAGARLALFSRPAPQLVEYRVEGEYYWVEVPLRFLSVSTDGQVPELAAPWGESHPAWSKPLVKGGRVVLYSPFSTSEKSSARFEALLTSRAIETIYGRSVSPEEILEHYLEVAGDRPVGLKAGGLTLLRDDPGLTAPPDGPQSAVFLALAIVPWFLATAIFFQTFRAPSSERRIQRAYWLILAVLLAAILVQATGLGTGWYDVEAMSAILGILIRRLGASSFTVTATWVVAVAASLAAYRLALGRYRRAELPASSIRLTLVDFSSGDS